VCSLLKAKQKKVCAMKIFSRPATSLISLRFFNPKQHDQDSCTSKTRNFTQSLPFAEIGENSCRKATENPRNSELQPIFHLFSLPDFFRLQTQQASCRKSAHRRKFQISFHQKKPVIPSIPPLPTHKNSSISLRCLPVEQTKIFPV